MSAEYAEVPVDEASPAIEPALALVPPPPTFVRAKTRRDLWIPKIVATGVGPAAGSPRLTGAQILIYLALLDACDNNTREHTIDPARIAARTGSAKETVLRVARGPLAKAGLVTVLRSNKGKPLRVRVTVGTARNRLVLPVAVVWPQKDTLRWTKNAGPAIRSLLAIVAVLDHKPLNAGQRVTTTLPVERIATPAGLQGNHYRLGLQAIVGSGPNTGVARANADLIRRPPGETWLLVEARTALHRNGRTLEDGSPMVTQDTCKVSIDWSALPLQMVPASAEKEQIGEAEKEQIGEAEKEQIGEAEKEQIGEAEKEQIGEAEKEQIGEGITPGTPPRQVLPPSGAPSLHADRVSGAFEGSSSANKGGRDDGNDQSSSKALQAAALAGDATTVEALIRGIDPDLMSHPTVDRTLWPIRQREELADEEWSAVVIAAVCGRGGLSLTATDARSLRTHLLTLRKKGWDALEVAQALTSDAALESVRSPVGLLVGRIGKRLSDPVEVTHGQDATALRLGSARRISTSTRPVDQPGKVYPESLF